MRLLALAVAAVVAAPACSLERSGLDPGRESRDGEQPDGGRRDGGGADASGDDATLRDAGEDAGGFDSGDEDAGFDAGEDDAGFDAGEDDAGFDAGEADAGFDAGLPPCDDLYGGAPGYVLCEETETECTFAASLSGSTCGALCPMFGGTCIRALDDGAPCVPFGGMDTCDTPRSTETCTCSRAMTDR